MNATTAYHVCQNHHLLPTGVLVCTTAFAVFASFMTLNAYFCCNTAVRHQLIRSMSTKNERRCILLHYLIALPLFEAFVIWGPHLDIRVRPCSASVVVGWLAILIVILLLLAAGFWSARAHVYSLQLTQVLQLPAMLLFLCDRALYHSLGVESIFIILILFLVSAEMFLRGKPVTAVPAIRDVRLDEFESVRAQDLRSYATGQTRVDHMTDDNYESGLDSEFMDEHRARNSTQLLMDFMKDLSRLTPANFTNEEDRKKYESLQRQASLYTVAVPLPHVAANPSKSNDVSGSANLDSRGFNTAYDDDF